MPNIIKTSSHRIATVKKHILSNNWCTAALTVDFSQSGVYTIPAGYTTLKAYIWGGKGANGIPDSTVLGGSGGSGAYLTGEFPITSGDNLQITVGQAGSVPFGRGGGGNGGLSSGSAGSAGGGGGLSSLHLNSIDLLIAGGGGGGGSSYVNPIVTGPTIGIDTTFQPDGHIRLVLS